MKHIIFLCSAQLQYNCYYYYYLMLLIGILHRDPNRPLNHKYCRYTMNGPEKKKNNHGSILLFFYILHYRLTYAENEPKMLLLLLVFFSTHRSCLVTIFKVNTMHDINTAYVFAFVLILIHLSNHINPV